ncbi:unnamed protein product [Lathyrus oleraceus]
MADHGIGSSSFPPFSSLNINPNPMVVPTPSLGQPSSSEVRELPEESITYMENIVLEIPIGNNVVEAIIEFARGQEASIVVTKGSGLVSDITLLEPDSRVAAFQLDGPFHVLSLTGVYLNPDCGRVPRLIYDPLCTAFCLQLSGSRGQVFGGVIGGNINAASDIQVSASLVKRPESIRIVTTNENVQLFEDDDVPTIVGGVEVEVDADANMNETQSQD